MLLRRTCPVVLGMVNAFRIGLRTPVSSTTPTEGRQADIKASSRLSLPILCLCPLLPQYPSVASSVGTVQAHHFQPIITEPIWPCSPRPWKLGVQGLWGNCCVCTCVCKHACVSACVCVCLSTDPALGAGVRNVQGKEGSVHKGNEGPNI